MKLEELEYQVKGLGANGAAGHWQLGRMISLFISGLEEMKENLELELSTVLSRI